MGGRERGEGDGEVGSGEWLEIRYGVITLSSRREYLSYISISSRYHVLICLFTESNRITVFAVQGFMISVLYIFITAPNVHQR